MASAPFGKEYTIAGVPAVSLTTILGGTRQFLFNLTIRAWTGNVDKVYFGPLTVTTAVDRYGFIQPGESMDVELMSYFSSGDLWVVGTPGDSIHVLGFA